VSGTERFTGDLPSAHGVVADHDAFAATAKNDVVPLSALFPDSVSEIAVNIHVIVLHGADTEKIVERERVEIRDGENVGGKLRGLFPS